MNLSKILMSMKIDVRYGIKNEKDFQTLGLIASNIGMSMCTFIDDEKYIDLIPENTNMVITTLQTSKKIKNNCGICITEQPRLLFFTIHNYLAESKEYCRSEFSTIIGCGCQISKLANISDKNVKIGNNVTIEEFVSIKENVEILDNSIIRAGSIIGGIDFEFKRIKDSIMSVNHYGGVSIGESVEIQHNCSVCRALYPWDNTVIGNNTKIDDLVQISHGVKIGNNVMIVGHTGIGGRTKVGNDTWIGYGVTIKNGLEIGNNCSVNMGAVVTKDVKDNQSVTGNFAIEHEKFIKFIKTIG